MGIMLFLLQFDCKIVISVDLTLSDALQICGLARHDADYK
jgi:hypothetical protein